MGARRRALDATRTRTRAQLVVTHAHAHPPAHACAHAHAHTQMRACAPADAHFYARTHAHMHTRVDTRTHSHSHSTHARTHAVDTGYSMGGTGPARAGRRPVASHVAHSAERVCVGALEATVHLIREEVGGRRAARVDDPAPTNISVRMRVPAPLPPPTRACTLMSIDPCVRACVRAPQSAHELSACGGESRASAEGNMQRHNTPPRYGTGPIAS